MSYGTSRSKKQNNTGSAKAIIKHSLKIIFGKEQKTGPLVAKGGFDIPFLILVCVLLTFGLVMMFSASYVSSQDDYGTPYHYIIRQLVFAAAGVFFMLVISKINHKTLKRFAPMFLIICLALLVIVLFFHKSNSGGQDDFKRWMDIGPISFQPSELAKFGLILFLAWSMDRHKALIEEYKGRMTIGYFSLILVIIALVFAENHLSGAILIAGIGIAMTYMGGLNNKIYIAGVIIAAAVILFIIINPESLVNSKILNSALKPYQMNRIKAWVDKDFDPLGLRWQTNNSLYAIGSGGFFGLGLGNSREKHLYLPEPQNDFIFAIVGEELGFFGCLVVIILFALLVWRGFVIAAKTKDRFGKFLVMGIVFQVGLQTVINILVVTDTLPNTGISLPFFSYGGSSLMTLLIAMGVVLSVSRSANLKKQ